MEFLAESIGLLDMVANPNYSSSDTIPDPTPTSGHITRALHFRSNCFQDTISQHIPAQNSSQENGSESCAVPPETTLSNCSGKSQEDSDQENKSQDKSQSPANDQISPPPALAGPGQASSLTINKPDAACSELEPFDSLLAKHVVQRIDSRTNYHCFTGTVDALTGHLIHGTMLHRSTGEVYDGPFVTVSAYAMPPASRPATAGTVAAAPGPEEGQEERHTISLRHGKNASCIYPDGMKFIGSFELDRPKLGTFIMAGEWTYEGPLITQQPPGTVEQSASVRPNKTPNKCVNCAECGAAIGLPPASPSVCHDATYSGPYSPSCPAPPPEAFAVVSPLSKQSPLKYSKPPKLIGVNTPLPGNVLFHGAGRFVRSDGLVYQGEFANGLAHGVGKEILPNGKGVYYGEFSNGLRHGVGTLMEEENDDDVCNCEQCERETEGNRAHQDHLASGPQHDQQHSILSSAATTITINIENGPDFAAGGYPSSLPPTPAAPANLETILQSQCTLSHTLGTNDNDSIATNNTPTINNAKNKPTCKRKCKHRCPSRKRRRYSSGVWCAGQYEIEDSCGTVHLVNNQVAEEIKRHEDSWHDNDHFQSKDNTTSSSATQRRSSLNRTTWDLLPEKWLGLGV